MTGSRLLLGGLLALAAGGLASGDEKRKEERPENAVRYAEPAPEMGKLAFLLGTWTAEEAWEDPRRWKRPGYEGYPGEAGHLTRTVERGPGGFSFVWKDEGRGPMGGYTAMAVLAWDPERRVYVLDRVHSLFAGIARMTGGFEKGNLVFRGEDGWTGRPRALVLTIERPEAARFTEVVEAAEDGGSMRRVVESRFRKVAPSP